MPIFDVSGLPPAFRNWSQCAFGHSRKAAYAAAKKIDPSVLLHTRLSPNMFDLARQVQVAADNAKNGSARLAEVEAPRYEDNETTIDQLKARLARTVGYLKTLDRKAIHSSAQREIMFRSARERHA